MSKRLRPDYHVTVDVYADTEVGVWLDRDRFCTWREGLGLNTELERAAKTIACARYDLDPEGLPWFSVFLQPGAPVLDVSHEALHLAWYILDAHGVKVTWDNHEALAYLQQHLAGKILARLPTEATT